MAGRSLSRSAARGGEKRAGNFRKQLSVLDLTSAASIVAWTFAASQLASALLAFKYFFLGPAILTLAVAALLTAGNLRKRKQRSPAPG
jgi:hypothetical protein